jgi:hypothetical protein
MNAESAPSNTDELTSSLAKRYSNSITNAKHAPAETNNTNGATTNMISSYSLSSSLSSSSSSASSSSIQAASNLNTGLSSAPLATICELAHFNSTKDKPISEPTKLPDASSLPSDNLAKKSEKTKPKLKKGSVNSLNLTATDNEFKYHSNASINGKHLSSLFAYSSQPAAKRAALNNTTASGSNTGKGIRNFFGKLIRTSLVNINESSLIGTSHANENNGTNHFVECDATPPKTPGYFKRGGTRATANARLQSNFSFSNSSLSAIKPAGKSAAPFALGADTFTFAKWSGEQVCEWLHKNGFEAYFPRTADGKFGHKWIKSGLHLLQSNQHDFEKELGLKNRFHRKRLTLLIESMYNSGQTDSSIENNLVNFIDQHWVMKWLDDIGLPQYKDAFGEAMIDGRMLHHLSNEDLQALNITSELHYLSVKKAVHVLRLNNFDPQCLRRRPSGDDLLDKSEVVLWTNHRVMEWLRSIDLSEYAPNLRGSGVHGGLMVFENRFNATVLADILSIPASKTLLRRHLTTLFNDLIGSHIVKLKKEAELQQGFQALSATSKVKHSRKGLGVSRIFLHKRTKSQDSRDFIGNSYFIMNYEKQNQIKTSQKKISMGNPAGQSATLPVHQNNNGSTFNFPMPVNYVDGNTFTNYNTSYNI